MVVTALERQLMNAIRPMQLERRKVTTSWNDVAAVNGSLGPTLDITFDKLDEYVPVERWRSGNPQLGQAEIVSDTGTIKAYFYGTEYSVPWWENWLRENAVRQPNASLFEGGLNNERFRLERMMQRLVAQIERDIDNDFYIGNSKISWGGITTLDSSPTTLSLDLEDPDGRKEFVDTLAKLKSDGATDLSAGRVVLAIDHAKMPFLAFPYEDTATGRGSLSCQDMMMKFVDAIIPVQNTNMADTALLHWQDFENIEVFDLTPKGVQIVVGEPARGEDQKVRVFHMWTAHEYRADTVKEIAGL